MRIFQVAVVGTVLVALGGCVSTNATMLGGATTGPAIPPTSVAIYRTPAQVPRHYTEVALLNSSGDSIYTDEKAMFTSMQKEAAKLGANGVILDNVKEPGSGAKVAAAIFGVSAQRKGTSIAISVDPVP
jgi:hypothetical protein